MNVSNERLKVTWAIESELMGQRSLFSIWRTLFSKCLILASFSSTVFFNCKKQHLIQIIYIFYYYAVTYLKNHTKSKVLVLQIISSDYFSLGFQKKNETGRIGFTTKSRMNVSPQDCSMDLNIPVGIQMYAWGGGWNCQKKWVQLFWYICLNPMPQQV